MIGGTDASIVGKNRVVFNVGGNSYRLVVAVQYEHRMLAWGFRPKS